MKGKYFAIVVYLPESTDMTLLSLKKKKKQYISKTIVYGMYLYKNRNLLIIFNKIGFETLFIFISTKGVLKFL